MVLHSGLVRGQEVTWSGQFILKLVHDMQGCRIFGGLRILGRNSTTVFGLFLTVSLPYIVNRMTCAHLGILILWLGQEVQRLFAWHDLVIT